MHPQQSRPMQGMPQKMAKNNAIIIYTIAVCLSCLYLNTQVHLLIYRSLPLYLVIGVQYTWPGLCGWMYLCVYGATMSPLKPPAHYNSLNKHPFLSGKTKNSLTIHTIQPPTNATYARD